MDEGFGNDLEMHVRMKVVDIQTLLASGVASATLEEVNLRLDGVLEVLRADTKSGGTTCERR